MEGMSFLHSKKLMHRDIKPGNILHNSRGEVKLTDFGIAKKMDDGMASMAKTFVGTTIYMSPERLLGEDYSYGADVWSLGMTYYELATGKYPFPDTSSFPALFESLCEKPEPRLDAEVFPQRLCDYVAACLTRDVGKRLDALSLTRHDFVVTDASSPQDLAAWLQKQGFGVSLYTLAEDDAENARTTMTQPTSVPPGKGAPEVTTKGASLGLESLSMEELKYKALEAGVPQVVLGAATREDLIAFMSG
eukprot:UN1518